MRPMPLRWRVCLLMIAAMIVVIVAVSWAAYYELQESMQASIDQTLRAMAMGMVADLDEARTPAELNAEARLVTGEVKAASRRPSLYRIWVTGAREDLAPPATAETLNWLRDLPAPPREGEELFFETASEGQPYRALWVRARGPLGQTNVVVAYSTHRLAHEMHEFLRLLIVLGISMAAGLAVVGSLTVLWAMRPLGKAARQLRKLSHHDLDDSGLDELPMPAELRPFMQTAKSLLERLGKVLRRQQQFTADASHELRTPLSVAKSTLQLARCQDRSGEQYRRAIDDALGDLDRMEKLVQQLLVLARLDETRLDEQAQDVPLAAMLGELAESHGALAAGKGVAIQYSEDAADLRVRGEEGLLRRLVGNLLENAIRHGPAGGTVRLSLCRQDGQAEIRVHDDGGGIPPEALGRLFDRFYRVDGSRSSQTGGAGLGLAIAREIARRHGGDIEIESDPAAGTDVRVRLPLAPGKLQD